MYPRRFPPGVYKHRSFEEAERLAEQWDEENFRRHQERLARRSGAPHSTQATTRERVHMSTSFWSEGANRLRKARKAKRKEIDRLTRELEQAETEAERQFLEEQLRTLIEDEDPSERDVDHSLFVRERP